MWKVVSLRLILKDKGGKQHCYHFVGSNWRLRYFEKEKISEKGCAEIEVWGTSAHSVLEFQENSMQRLSAFL